MEEPNENKLIVFLFPSEEFINVQNQFFKEEIDENFEICSVFDSIIQKRYIDNGYEFIIVNYIDKSISGITLEPSKVVLTDVSQNDYYLDYDNINKRYLELARKINPNNYSEIKVGGYHVGDCVDKFTSAINSINPVATIDYEITNKFPNFVFDNKLQNYNQEYEFYEEIKKRNNLENKRKI